MCDEADSDIEIFEQMIYVGGVPARECYQRGYRVSKATLVIQTATLRKKRGGK